MHPVHARLAEALHLAARSLTGLACPGTGILLAAAAAEAGTVQKCAAVAWTLEVGAACREAASWLRAGVAAAARLGARARGFPARVRRQAGSLPGPHPLLPSYQLVRTTPASLPARRPWAWCSPRC